MIGTPPQKSESNGKGLFYLLKYSLTMVADDVSPDVPGCISAMALIIISSR